MKKKYYILYCLVIALVVLLFTSESSPFYLINDWVDVNSFFTTGKGMMNGKIPYLDLFEQKGPTLYFLYGIGYLISHTSFFGVFILEVLSATIFLYYVGKITDLFSKSKVKYLLSPLFISVVFTSLSFANGGSAEEFCFPLFAISLYYYLSFLKSKNITYKELFINGLMAGLVFTIKYTLLGLWFGWMATIFFYLIGKKEIKKSFLGSLTFLLGMFLPFGIWCIYFLIAGGLTEFIKTYFILNLTVYSTASTSILSQFKLCFDNFLDDLQANGFIIVVLFVYILVFINDEFSKNSDRLMLCVTLLFSIIFVYIGGTHFSYYCLILLPWLMLSFIFLIKLLPKKIYSSKVPFIILLIVVNGISLAISFYGANYKDRMFNDRLNDYHFIFADIIKQDKIENQTLLNYGALDFGLYTTTGIIPNVRYFHMLNLPYDKYPYIVDSHNEYVTNKRINYILFATFSNETVPAGLLINYDIAATKRQMHADLDFTFYLLKLKEEL